MDFATTLLLVGRGEALYCLLKAGTGNNFVSSSTAARILKRKKKRKGEGWQRMKRKRGMGCIICSKRQYSSIDKEKYSVPKTGCHGMSLKCAPLLPSLTIILLAIRTHVVLPHGTQSSHTAANKSAAQENTRQQTLVAVIRCDKYNCVHVRVMCVWASF